MAVGPGKYGPLAERLIHEIEGTVCIVITMGGPQGPSFDMTSKGLPIQELLQVPEILHNTASMIEADLGNMLQDFMKAAKEKEKG